MDDLWRQDISIDGENDPDPDNILDEVPQPENGYNLEIRRNHLPKLIKQSTQHLRCFQKLFLWGGNEDDELVAIFIFFPCWISKRGNCPQNE